MLAGSEWLVADPSPTRPRGAETGFCTEWRSYDRNKEFEQLPKRIESRPLTSLQQRLVKTGGRLVKPARYHWLMLAEGHLTQIRFAAMLRRIAMLRLPAS